MSATLPVMTPLPEPPNLLVEWEPRWTSFVTSLRPAMQRSTRQLQGECHPGLFPLSGMAVTWVL